MVDNTLERPLGKDSARDQVWTDSRRDAQSVTAVAAAGGLKRYAERVEACSPELDFEQHLDRTTGELKYKLKRAFFCHFRHCPVCFWRRSLRMKARFLSMVPSIQMTYPNTTFLLLTLTVPNCDIADLREKLGVMNIAWKRLIQRVDFKPILGFIRATEVTKSKAGQAHPHFHVLLLVRNSYFKKHYISQAKWLDMWQDCMRDQSITQVDIRRVKGTHDAAAEVLKYATKSGDLIGKGADDQASVSWFREYVEQTKKLRFLATGGVLKDALKEEEKPDLVHVDEHPDDDLDDEIVAEMRYYYNFFKRDYYKKTEVKK